MEYFSGIRFLYLAVMSLIIVPAFSNGLKAEEKNDALKVGTTTYLSYETKIDNTDGMKDGSFRINRSYLTVQKPVTDFLKFRITLDSYQDDAGSMNIRLKYVYANFKFSDFLVFTKPNIEFGLVHTPWLDFEEHINYYRMQGTMFMERNHLFNSADFGLTAGANLGGEMDDNYKKEVNPKYAGRYGSVALGVYNGGGYHAKEKNSNSVVEGRLTIRPLPDVIPGLQASIFGTYGKMNVSDTMPDNKLPDWNTNAVMLSYENHYVTVTGQFVTGKGSQGNKYMMVSDSSYASQNIRGYSLFAEGKLTKHWRVIGRYDSFDPNTNVKDDNVQRVILGVGYDFGHHNVLLLDFDKQFYNDSKTADVNMLKLTMALDF